MTSEATNSCCGKNEIEQLDSAMKALQILRGGGGDDGGDDGLEYLQDKCGIFGCIANGEWPTNIDVAHIICLGLVGLQHR